MKKYLPFILLLLLVPISANARSLTEYILTEWLNIPEEWTRPPNLIPYVFIPFLGTFAIIWGILTATKVKIFEKPKVNILLSFVFALALFYSGIMPAVVLYLFTFGGAFGVIAFFVLFFVLTTLFGIRRIETDYLKTMKTHEKVTKKGIEEEIKTLRKESNRLEKIRKKEEDIREELNRINDAISATKEHIRIIRDPHTPPEELMERYHTDKPRKAEEKMLKLLKKQRDKKLVLLHELRKLEREKKKLQRI